MTTSKTRPYPKPLLVSDHPCHTALVDIVAHTTTGTAWPGWDGLADSDAAPPPQGKVAFLAPRAAWKDFRKTVALAGGDVSQLYFFESNHSDDMWRAVDALRATSQIDNSFRLAVFDHGTTYSSRVF